MQVLALYRVRLHDPCRRAAGYLPRVRGHARVF
jgi:hypothetical protein